CRRRRLAAEVVLADRSLRKVHAELGDRAGDVRGKSVRIRSRPDDVFMGVGILAHGLVDALDQRIDALAALLSQELGRMAEPARIGRTSADRQRGPRSAKVRV